ncbi:hypothetical protein RSAG8_10692, partial [Rhizoctonia solani AG-8 WAC10335]
MVIYSISTMSILWSRRDKKRPRTGQQFLVRWYHICLHAFGSATQTATMRPTLEFAWLRIPKYRVRISYMLMQSVPPLEG